MSMACKVCGGKTVHVFSRNKGDGTLLESKLHGDDYERPYFQCSFCGLLYHTAFDAMDGGQYTLMGSGSSSSSVGDGVEPTINRAVRELNIASRLMALHDLDPRRLKLLVFGCGAGASLNLYLQNGLNAFGTDIILSIRRGLPLPPDVFKEDLVPEMLKRFLPPDDLPPAGFDIITLTEVFEHFTDPLKEMAAMVKLLKPGGMIFGTTGMADRVQGAHKDWWYLKCLTHTLFLTRKSFAILCAKLGVLGMIYPGALEFKGHTDMSLEQGIFVLQKP